MALLPSFFILQSGARYLNLTQNIPASLPSGFLKFDEEQIWSPRVKFAAEPAKTGDGRFVHIRSLYNNKYLVKKQMDDKKSWIVASGKNPEEDTSKDSCTLFEPFSLKDDGPKSVRLRQVQSQNIVTLSGGDAQQGLVASSSSSNGSVFSVIDRASLVVLPSQVAFKSGGNYMRSIYLEDHGYQMFESGYELAHERVAKELIPTADGNYNIKDLFWGNFLKRYDSWIWSESTENTSKETMFSFVQIQDNVFGVRCLGNNYFCGPLTAEGKVDCLNAHYLTLTSPARLIVEERVFNREILNIEYRIADSRIYDQNPVELDAQTTTNLLTDSDTTSTLTFQESKSNSTLWTNSQTINFGVSVSMTIAAIPFISEAGIELHTDFTNTYKWGETETNTETTEVSHDVPVPPLKTYVVSLMATAGVCEVPFSYIQRDLFTDGTSKDTPRDDGLFTGINSYDFRYDQKESDD